ncbi:MAG: hypothetical protein V3T83_18205 [Acidobacteriota bacterium]
MRTTVELNPQYPEFFATDLPRPNIESLEDFAEAYSWWAETSGVMEWVEGAEMRIVAADLLKRIEEPVSHGLYAGRPRFASRSLADKLGVGHVPFPEDSYPWLMGSVSSAFARLAYIQGSSEYASSQQQRDLMRQGHVPAILERYIRATIIEEGEHGIQMAGWLISESENDLGKLLAEDLLARKADHPDPQLQQPLVEFNPSVATLPEFAHYLDKQDRDGWSQLRCSVDNASALYAGMMQFFLRQEARHMRSGEQLIEWCLLGRKIPMELHLKMEWEWDAISYRLHGVPYGSSGALTQYQLGTKNPIYPLDGRYQGTRFRIPHPDGPEGYKTIEVSPSMDLEHLNGYSVCVLRDVLRNNNRRRTKLLDDRQLKEMREFLSRLTQYVPDRQRKKLLEDHPIPTAALSWRPEHLALEQMDRWRHISGYWTDVFGYPIPTEKEYREYRKLVELTEEDRQQIRQITAKPGWMIEDVKPDDRQDIYRTGPIEPRDSDTVLHQWTVGKKRTNRTYFTMPQAMDLWSSKPGEEAQQKAFEYEDGYQTLLSLHDDLIQ